MNLNGRSISRDRLRLSRSLGVRAIAALALQAGLGLGLLVMAVVLGLSGLQMHFDGRPGVAVMVIVAGLCMFPVGFKLLAWLYVPEQLPEGVALRHGSDTSLRLLIERVGRRFGSPRVDFVWIVSNMNAAVVQRPQWGMFGPMRTHMLLGLPLLHSVSNRQLAAIIAHEFGHLMLQRQGVDAWICHSRAWWFRVMDRVIDEVPRLSAFVDRLTARAVIDSLHLAHLEEFEADDAAARVAGARLVSEALVEIALKERFLAEDYWGKVMAQSALRSSPSIRPYREMGLGMAAGFRPPASAAMSFASEMLASGDSSADLHPSLAQRLHALGTTRIAARGDERSAADTLLGARTQAELALTFDRAWWADIRRDWRKDYERASQCQKASRSASR